MYTEAHAAYQDLKTADSPMNRDWSIATQKASNAIVEALAFDVIRRFYEYQTPPLRMNRIDYNSGLDLVEKQKFDLIDGYGKKWEVKTDKKWQLTGNVFFEHLSHSDFDYLIMFAFCPYVLTRQQYLDIIADTRYTVTSSHEAFNRGSLVPLSELTDFIV